MTRALAILVATAGLATAVWLHQYERTNEALTRATGSVYAGRGAIVFTTHPKWADPAAVAAAGLGLALGAALASRRVRTG